MPSEWSFLGQLELTSLLWQSYQAGLPNTPKILVNTACIYSCGQNLTQKG